MSKNVHFIYMPIPNKETIYPDMLPGKPQVSVLKQLLHELEQKGVPTINLVDAFEVYRVKGGMPYQVDDTHWSEDGVKIAADLLTAKITELNSRN